MLWKFRYRDKFSYQEVTVDAPNYDQLVTHARAWCEAKNYRYIDGSACRAVLFSVEPDGRRIEHDPTGADLVRPAATTVKAKTA